MDLRTRRIPKIYKELEYIQSSGTQYIDVGIKATQNTKIDVLFSKLNSATTFPVNGIVGARGGNASDNNIVVGQAGVTVVIDFNNSNYATYRYININTLENTQYRAILSKEKRELYKGNTLIGSNTTLCTDTITTINNINMFRVQNYGYTSAKIYYCRIWENGTLIKNLIPAQRISDSVLGMYDTVTDTFLTNAGTGTFIAGAEVKTVDEITIDNKDVKELFLPHSIAGYEFYEYIQGTGTQYINTGVISDDCVIDQDVAFTGGVITYMGFSGNGGQYWGITAEDKYTIGTAVINTLDAKERHNMVCTVATDTLSITVEGETISRAKGALITAPYCTKTFTGGNGYKLYGLKITDAGVLVRNMFPAKRLSDNAIGMYDFVTKTFFTNAGTGVFTTGSVLNPQVSVWKKYLVPSIYTVKNYLQSDGNQWIDTGVLMTGFSIKSQVKFRNIASTLNRYTVFGSWHGANSSYSLDSQTSRYSQTSASTIMNQLNQDYIAEFGSNGITINGTLYSFDATPDNFTITDRSITLFKSSNSTTSITSLRVYYFRIYDGNTLVRDMIPVIRNSDSKPGMYDRCTDTFYVNQGSGADFTVG